MAKSKSAPPAAPTLEVLYKPDQIAKRVSELAKKIRQDFEGKPMTVVGVLKGAFVFMSDLVRQIDADIYCDFLRVSSYGQSTMSGGTVRIEFDLTQPIENKNVLLVEDIVDTGMTLKALLDYLRPKKPRVLKSCALLLKRGREQVAVPVDYSGFEVPNKFIVGYGLDLNGRYRNLPHLSAMTQDVRPFKG